MMPYIAIGSDNELETVKVIIQRLEKELEMAKKQIELLWERNGELERLSIIDELTGLYNQRHFYDRLEQEVARSSEQKYLLCLLFFDVDGLKTYNDTYGHLGGDNVLRAVAWSLSENVRKNVDSGYRYGGDEFAAILPEVHADQAVKIAKRINRGLRESDFQNVSLSFGISELGPGMDSKVLFRHADKAMYMAKRGKNVKSKAYKDKIYVYGNTNHVFLER